MGGQNPYIQQPSTHAPTRKYKVLFLPDHVEVEVDPTKLPYGHDGLPGSILDIALAHGVDIDHACGGVCACSTCHVRVKEGLDTCGQPSDEEEDMLDNAPSPAPDSRLACQTVPDGTKDIVVEIPEWNRNLASEGD
jgi:2Fe-2S ferredoxin